MKITALPYSTSTSQEGTAVSVCTSIPLHAILTDQLREYSACINHARCGQDKESLRIEELPLMSQENRSDISDTKRQS